jgi:hypothetical protein
MLLNPITHSANVKLNLAAISFIWSSTMSPVYFLSEKSLQKPKRSQGASQRGVFSVFVFVPFTFDDFFTCLVSPLKCLLYTMILIQHIGMALPISTIQLGQKQTNTYNFEFLNHVGFWQGVMYMWFLSKVFINRCVKQIWPTFYGFFSETKSRVIMITFF